jgi:hypothetical protein
MKQALAGFSSLLSHKNTLPDRVRVVIKIRVEETGEVETGAMELPYEGTLSPQPLHEVVGWNHFTEDTYILRLIQ